MNTGALYRPTGGPPFNRPFDAAPAVGASAGTVTLMLADGNAATFVSTVDSVTQARMITRVAQHDHGNDHGPND